MKATLRCNCGQRLFSRDVMQQGYLMRHFGPSFVYIRFRCSRCKKLGEHFIKQEEWEEGILRDDVTELTDDERRRFGKMGAITVEEMAGFHYELARLGRKPDSGDEKP